LTGRKIPIVYNLSWFSKAVATKENPAGMPKGRTGGVISDQKTTPAIILYPVLATPEILVGNDNLEMLLLLKKDEGPEKLKLRITNQLKVSQGLDPEKKCPDRALFVDATGRFVGYSKDGWLNVKKLDFSPDDAISTASGRFSCFVEKHAYNLFVKAGYSTLYSVSMPNQVLQAGLGSGLSTVGEPHDQLIKSMLDKRSSWAKVNDKYYCFQTANYDLLHSVWDTSNPIQSYHPVFHYDDLKFANIAHLTDVHVAARQQALQKTIARVIDTWDSGTDVNLDYCPKIGSMVNSCSRVMWELLNKLTAKNPDILVIGGDLVDCLLSCYVDDKTSNDPHFDSGLPWRIWDVVGLGGNYTNFYKHGTDMIGFLTLLLNQIRSQSMPAYAITGNHDCYYLPYGLSPRLFASTIDKRANEGIPSDHNLTFYEAILAFGETFGELKSGLSSPFDPDMWDWFYTVYTPFADFSIELPKQSLVALGWGDREGILNDLPGTGQGFGHLGRSKDAISDEQLGLLITAIGKGKRTILTTHFTFVSYEADVPGNQGESDPRDIYISLIKDYNEYNSGCFQENREAVLKTRLVTARDVQIVLTGHSHRRAMYLADHVSTLKDRFGTLGRQSIKVLNFDFDQLSYAKSKYPDPMKCPVIVSDSGGTIPRYNYGGEFKGRGSDPPGGTYIGFDQTSGDLVHLEAVRSKVKPRVAVAVDYLNIQEKVTIIKSFESQYFSVDDERHGKVGSFIFTIKLTDKLPGFWIENLAFFVWTAKSAISWKRIVLMPPDVGGAPQAPRDASTEGNLFAIIQSEDVKAFTEDFSRAKERCLFFSMKFGKPLRPDIPGFDMPRYDFTSPWCGEFQLSKPKGKAGTAKYVFNRDRKVAEKPNFGWRRDYIGTTKYMEKGKP
jgi:Calcineurin-like phosphoesterase